MRQAADKINMCIRCKRLPHLRCGFEERRRTVMVDGFLVTTQCDGWVRDQEGKG